MAEKPSDNKPENSKKDSLSDKLEALKKNKNVEGIYNYAASNTKDTIAYILMVIGIVMLFTHSFYGGTIVGILFGLYFSKELVEIFNNLNDLIEQQGMVRSLIFGGLLLALFIMAPSIFIGVALAVGLRYIIFPESS
ncbi:MAG: hypothetical protein KDK62_06500, partial [Chlamydiia bacterium]|nr:hypothetical protein [Chlamydiia bacterium]